MLTTNDTKPTSEPPKISQADTEFRLTSEEPSNEELKKRDKIEGSHEDLKKNR